MNKIHYDLEPGEIALLANTSVRRGVKGSCDNELVLTNRNFVFVELGMFGSVKQITIYPLDIISQTHIGIAKNGEKQLQIVYGNAMDGFSFATDEKREMRLWCMAVRDQKSEYGAYFDAAYYGRFDKENLKRISRQISEGAISEEDVTFDISALGEIAASLLGSGSFSTKNLQKALKRIDRTKSSGGGIFKSLKDELGITEIQNEFRDMFGMEVEETNNEREDRLLDAAFEYEAYRARMEIAALQQQEQEKREQAQAFAQTVVGSVDDQIEMVKKLKELLDAGILTQDEFDEKKKEVMGL